MDWSAKTQEMVNNWIETQQKMAQAWMESLQGASSPSTNWDKTVKTWENGFKNFIESQTMWLRMWMRNMSENVNFEGADDFTKAIEDMTHQWVTTQEKLWATWFETLKQFNPEAVAKNTKSDTQNAVNLWQDNLKKVMDAQSDWLNQWAKQFEGKK